MVKVSADDQNVPIGTTIPMIIELIPKATSKNYKFYFDSNYSQTAGNYDSEYLLYKDASKGEKKFHKGERIQYNFENGNITIGGFSRDRKSENDLTFYFYCDDNEETRKDIREITIREIKFDFSFFDAVCTMIGTDGGSAISNIPKKFDLVVTPTSTSRIGNPYKVTFSAEFGTYTPTAPSPFGKIETEKPPGEFTVGKVGASNEYIPINYNPGTGKTDEVIVVPYEKNYFYMKGAQFDETQIVLVATITDKYGSSVSVPVKFNVNMIKYGFVVNNYDSKSYVGQTTKIPFTIDETDNPGENTYSVKYKKNSDNTAVFGLKINGTSLPENVFVPITNSPPTSFILNQTGLGIGDVNYTVTVKSGNGLEKTAVVTGTVEHSSFDLKIEGKNPYHTDLVRNGQATNNWLNFTTSIGNALGTKDGFKFKYVVKGGVKEGDLKMGGNVIQPNTSYDISNGDTAFQITSGNSLTVLDLDFIVTNAYGVERTINAKFNVIDSNFDFRIPSSFIGKYNETVDFPITFLNVVGNSVFEGKFEVLEGDPNAEISFEKGFGKGVYQKIINVFNVSTKLNFKGLPILNEGRTAVKPYKIKVTIRNGANVEVSKEFTYERVFYKPTATVHTRQYYFTNKSSKILFSDINNLRLKLPKEYKLIINPATVPIKEQEVGNVFVSKSCRFVQLDYRDLNYISLLTQNIDSYNSSNNVSTHQISILEGDSFVNTFLNKNNTLDPKFYQIVPGKYNCTNISTLKSIFKEGFMNNYLEITYNFKFSSSIIKFYFLENDDDPEFDTSDDWE